MSKTQQLKADNSSMYMNIYFEIQSTVPQQSDES